MLTVTFTCEECGKAETVKADYGGSSSSGSRHAVYVRGTYEGGVIPPPSFVKAYHQADRCSDCHEKFMERMKPVWEAQSRKKHEEEVAKVRRVKRNRKALCDELRTVASKSFDQSYVRTRIAALVDALETA